MDKSKIHPTLHVGSPNIGNRERFLRYVDEMFDRRWLTNRGTLVLEFEKRLAEYIGTKHCITTCNGTKGLEIAARALDLTGEVILPSFTFVATAHALQWQGIKPVFCDIDRDTYCIDPTQIERHITPETTGIVGVHLFSRPCDTQALQSIADKYGLKLLFDAAHAFGCSHHGQMIGNFGDCEVFSFHATKFFNSFEGGAIATNNDELAEKIRLMQDFGFREMDEVVHLGTNGKMTEVCAAMGLTNMDEIDSCRETNKRNYCAYKEGLAHIPGIKLIEYAPNELSNWHYAVVEVGDEYPLSRDELMIKLHEQNILARRYFWPGCHQMEPYKSAMEKVTVNLPTTKKVANRVLGLPMGNSITGDDIQRILLEMSI